MFSFGQMPEIERIAHDIDDLSVPISNLGIRNTLRYCLASSDTTSQMKRETVDFSR
jgi:hypothetical protein